MPSKVIRTPQRDFQLHLQAAALLSAWERGRPLGAAPITPEFCAAFARFAMDALSGSPEDINLELADFYEVLFGASALAMGCAQASGTGRGQRALSQAIEQQQVVGDLSQPAKTVLAIQCCPGASLEMDELTEITESLQAHLGSDCEMIFGYGETSELADELRVMFLVASGHKSV